MNQDILISAGLTKTQAQIYEYLLNNKDAKANTIAKDLKISRGAVYYTLDELVALNLAEKIDKPNQVSLFKAGHPAVLQKLFEQKEKDLTKERSALNSGLPDLVSAYNLSHNKPGIKFYEGEEGIWRVLEDTLTSRTEILTIADVEAVNKYLKEINRQYVDKRNKLGIKKRLIAVDSPYAREHFSRPGDYTDVKLMKTAINPFNTSIHIYDNKIAYITMAETYLTGVIINDPHIYSMQKSLFEQIWVNGQSLIKPLAVSA